MSRWLPLPTSHKAPASLSIDEDFLQKLRTPGGGLVRPLIKCFSRVGSSSLAIIPDLIRLGLPWLDIRVKLGGETTDLSIVTSSAIDCEAKDGVIRFTYGCSDAGL